MIESPTFIQIRMMDNSLQGWGVKYDAAKSTVLLSRNGHAGNVLRYSRRDAEHLFLEGQLDGSIVSIRLRQINPSKFLLVSRGFHWINEMPFNR